jgi:4'-phosphopantetheinyl transferase
VDLLNPTERQRRERYLRAADRDRFTIGVVLTRLILSGILGTAPEKILLDRTCPDCGKPHGAPRLPSDSGPYVSISHSGDRVAVAVSQYDRLGVDVEGTGRFFGTDLRNHVLSAAERARGDHGPGLVAYWTRKEAILKATGDGLRIPMTELTVSAPAEAPRLLAWESRPHQVERITMHALDPGSGYAACLALIDQPDVRVHQEQAAPLLRASPAS